MKFPFDDLQFAVFLGVCFASSAIAVFAAAGVRKFVREFEPTLVSRFAIAPRRPFLSFQSAPERDTGDEQLFRWLSGGGALELIERWPNFSARWKWYRSTKLVSSVLICLWLVVGVWRLVQGNPVAG